LLAIAIGILLPVLTLGTRSIAAIAGCIFGCWAIFAALEDLVRRSVGRRFRWPRQIVGMTLAHIVIGILVIGISLTSGFGREHDARMTPGDAVDLAEYSFVFHGTQDKKGPNYKAQVGDFSIRHHGHIIARVHPAKRHYDGNGMTTTESGISYNVFRDLYVSLGNSSGTRAWSVRIYYRPFVRWIWAGGLIAALGGLIALTDKRYWRKSKRFSSGVQPHRRATA
jgi:cytochrome c-type biogenesis protein CcmF